MVTWAMAAMLLTVVEPSTGLEVTPPPGLPCVYLPEGALPALCPAMEPQRLLNAKAGGTWLLAMSADGAVVLTGTALHGPKTRHVMAMSDHDVDGFVTSVAEGMQNVGTFAVAKRPPHLFSLTTVNGLLLAQFRLDADEATRARVPNLSTGLGVLVPTEDVLVTLIESSATVDPSFQSAVASLRAPAGLQVDTERFAHRADVEGPLPRVISFGCCGASALGTVALLVRWRRGLKRSAPRVDGPRRGS
jgi:hypothetical protein